MKNKKQEPRKQYNPTLEEIRHRCSQIQSSWSGRERFKRAGLVESQWQPPTVPLDDLTDLSMFEPGRN